MTTAELILFGAGAVAIVALTIAAVLLVRRIRFRLVVPPSQAGGEAGPERAPAEPTRCTIDLVRDPGGARWEARSTAGPVAASPRFPLGRLEVPQPTVASLAALEALSAELEREGWILSGRDEAWYARRYVRSLGRRASPAVSRIAPSGRRRSRG